MSDHRYFTVNQTAASPSKDRIAVHFQEAPKRNEEGRTTAFSMIFPGLIVSECVADPEDFAKTVAEVLNENAHRFFASAKKEPA